MSYSHSFKTILYSLRFIILSTIIFFSFKPPIPRFVSILQTAIKMTADLLFNENISALGLLFTFYCFSF
jgi:hypothetical protein